MNGEVTEQAEALLTEYLHLARYGERAPGGSETWADLSRKVEAFLRRDEVLDVRTPYTPPFLDDVPEPADNEALIRAGQAAVRLAFAWEEFWAAVRDVEGGADLTVGGLVVPKAGTPDA